jgi:hypothetical protein
MPDLSHLKNVKNPHAKPKTPLWAGPSGDGWNGGVTQSMLARYLTCKERFRAQYVEGWHTADRFNHRMEFGSMWHVCEENIAGYTADAVTDEGWMAALAGYTAKLSKRYMMDRAAVQHWHEICLNMFPLYVQHWSGHPDTRNRVPLLEEYPFDVPYPLASGRTVRLRGKWDSVDMVGGAVWLQENKTKSSIDEGKIRRTLIMDLQTMLYLVALNVYRYPRREGKGSRDGLLAAGVPIAGVRYNVIRRSAHKSVDSMLKKVEDDRAANRIGEWFARWEVRVSPKDVQRFRTQCLDPLLENLCDDYEWWDLCYSQGSDVFDYPKRDGSGLSHKARHYVTPFYYDPITEGGGTDLDDCLLTGSTIGMQRPDKLFPELVM